MASRGSDLTAVQRTLGQPGGPFAAPLSGRPDGASTAQPGPSPRVGCERATVAGWTSGALASPRRARPRCLRPGRPRAGRGCQLVSGRAGTGTDRRGKSGPHTIRQDDVMGAGHGKARGRTHGSTGRPPQRPCPRHVSPDGPLVRGTEGALAVGRVRSRVSREDEGPPPGFDVEVVPIRPRGEAHSRT